MIDISLFSSNNEYDAYLRPVLNLGHCQFKGGSSSTTVQQRNIPNQTEEEKQLQDKLQKYSESGLTGATKLQKEALDYLNKTKKYDWDKLLQKYHGDIDKALGELKKSGDQNLADYANKVDAERQEYLKNANKNYADQKKESDLNTQNYANDQQMARHNYEEDSRRNASEYADNTNNNALQHAAQLDGALEKYKKGVHEANDDADRRGEANAAAYANSQQKNVDRNYDELTRAREAYADNQRDTLSDYTNRRDSADNQHNDALSRASDLYRNRQQAEAEHYEKRAQNDINGHRNHQQDINNEYRDSQQRNIDDNQFNRETQDNSWKNERQGLIQQRDADNRENNENWERRSEVNNIAGQRNRRENEDWYDERSQQNLRDKDNKLAKSERDYVDNQSSNVDRYRKEQQEHLDSYTNKQDSELAGYKNDKWDAAKQLYNRQQDYIRDRSSADSLENNRNTRNNASYLDNWNNRSQQLNDQHKDELTSNTGDYTSKLDEIGNKYAPKIDEIQEQYKNQNQRNADKWEELSNGKLGGEWAANRRQALKDDMDAMSGSWLSNMARRGIINSSTANTGLDSLNQSVSDSLAKSFSNDMAQQAGLLRDQQASDQNRYQSLYNMYANDRTDAENRAKAAYDARNVLSNSSYNDAYKQAADFFNQQNKNELQRHQDALNYNQNVYNENTDAAKTYNSGLNDAYDKSHQTAVDNQNRAFAAQQQADTNNYNAATNFNQNLYNNRNSQAQQGFADAQGITDTLNKQRQADEAARYEQEKNFADTAFAHNQARTDAYNNAMIDTADKYYDARSKAEADRFNSQTDLNNNVYNHGSALENDVYKGQSAITNQLHNDQRNDNTAYYNNDRYNADSAQKSALDTAAAIYGARSKMDDANNQARVNAENQRYTAQDKANTQAYSAIDAYNKAKDARNLDALKDIYSGATNNAESAYKANSAAADNIYKTNQNVYDNIYKAANTDNNNIFSARQKATDNYYGGINAANQHNFDTGVAARGTYFNGAQNQAQNMFTATTGAADKSFTGAGTAQANGFYAPGKMLDFAQNLYLPGQNMFNTMYSGRMGTGSTATTTSKSGDNSSLWGAAGTVGGALIMCFTAGTKVTTPNGYKNIEDIQVGDEVLSLNEKGDIVTKKVTQVNKPHIMDVVDATFENGTIWHTTTTQRYYDGKHFSYLDYPGKAVTFHGKPSPIVSLKITGKKALVYDFAVDGLNVFFANDVAAEGVGD